MSKTFLGLALIAATLSAAVPAAAGETLKASPIIFDAAHLKNTNAGDEIVYDFSRTVSDEKLVGTGFKDKITLKVADVKDGKRAVDLQIYTGERARDLQKLDDLTINPMFVVTMQQAVASFRMMGGGDLTYLKSRFTKSIDQKALVEPCKIDYKGQTVDAFRINVEPFRDDPNVARMKGYEASTFTLIVSPAVPGELVEAIAVTKSLQNGSPSFEERTTLAGYGGLK